eukprot:gene43950-54613_t
MSFAACIAHRALQKKSAGGNTNSNTQEFSEQVSASRVEESMDCVQTLVCFAITAAIILLNIVVVTGVNI